MLFTDEPAVALGRDTLYEVIGVVARDPDPGRVLPAIVDLLADATACHACFIYLREDELLRMRAASPAYAHAVGRVALGLDEGLCGWVARHRTPAFIREGAQDDPRVKHVPELDEDRFQSMVAVPLLGRDGDAIGVVVLHTEAPREFGREVLDFLVHVAALVAGAIDNARLVEASRRQVATLSSLIERLTEEHLVRDLFDALAEGRPHAAESRARAAGHDLDRPHVVAVLEPLGAPAAGWSQTAARAEARLRRTVPGTLCDPGDERLRALLPLGGGDDASELARIDGELARLAVQEGLAGGRSEPRRGLAGDERGLAEAGCAARVARATAPGGGTRAYGELGVYRYLAQLPAGHAPDERHAAAITTLAAYDAKRRTELLQTLERHLGDRGALAATARALYIHTNTLRQRLDRIESLTGLDLAQEDLLSLELALKLARLHGTT
jgi:GAF domain-containing protein